jgi:hypothetical protein
MPRQQKLTRAIRVTHCWLLSKYSCASVASRPAAQVRLTFEGSISTEEKSPKRKLVVVENPVTSGRSPEVRLGTPPPGRTPLTVSVVGTPFPVSV